jgi:hypothetical protein
LRYKLGNNFKYIQDSAGSGFDDHGGELELHLLDFTNIKSSSSTLLGKIRAK